MTTLAVITGDTLQSDSLEGRIWELTHLLTMWQKDTAKNPNNLNYVSWSISNSGSTMSAQYEFKTVQEFTNIGGITHTVTEYLVNTGFYNSSTVIRSSTPAAHLVELLFYAQQLESQPLKNPQNLNNISAGFPVDTDLFSGSASLSLNDETTTDGKPAFPVKTYLL
jgi:hypothetical protein